MTFLTLIILLIAVTFGMDTKIFTEQLTSLQDNLWIGFGVTISFILMILGDIQRAFK